MDDLLAEFLIEAGDSLAATGALIEALAAPPAYRESLAAAFRYLHTIKGTCGFVGLPRLAALAEAAEGLLAAIRDRGVAAADEVGLLLAAVERMRAIVAASSVGPCPEPQGDDSDVIAVLEALAAPPAEAQARAREAMFARAAAELAAHRARLDRRTPLAAPSVRVGVGTVEALAELAAEFAELRDRLIEVDRRNEESEFSAPLRRFARLTAELQGVVRRARLQPVGEAWQMLPRILADLTARLGKDIDVATAGGEIELDRDAVALMRDAVTHLVRNAADHGIEPAAERLALGKPARGSIRITARRAPGEVAIEVADDGRGLDAGRIRERARRSGLASAAELAALSEAELFRFALRPGFTTAGDVTRISGRGVGMDVVHSHVLSLGGSVELSSAPGRGTSVTIRLPVPRTAADPGRAGAERPAFARWRAA